MGNKCCGGRKKPDEVIEKDSEYNTKNTSKDTVCTKDTTAKKERQGMCPYCRKKITIPDNLKYIECTFCKEISMQDGCTETLYKYFLNRLPLGHCLRKSYSVES